VAVELVSETFTPYVGETFQLAPAEGDAFLAVLSSCDETPYGAPAEWRESVIGRVPFSLIFHHEGSTEARHQQVFSVSHPETGSFELFLVPLGPDARGMTYQAVIS